ncbi:hypothetical protein ACIB24_00580 [Spongisporangium articulatum]|uniref:Uncharacterized protein n=1 Tax=Spongisporangium articulatum TaxID=3362603 RepID=A0ABW8AGT3_9ACTN
MTIPAKIGKLISLPYRADAAQSAADAAAMMRCDTCDLVGGPFEPAEAKHLLGIHNQLHHGIAGAA